MIPGNIWRCDICRRTYDKRIIQQSIIHNGKTYCPKCHYDWQQQIIAESISRQKTEKRKQAFENARMQNGKYQPEKSGKPAVAAAGLLTLGRINDRNRNDILWAEVYGSRKKCHKTQYSGYHDEENDYYSTVEIQTLPFLETENWFDGEEWIQKTAVPHTTNNPLDLDSIYYEGYGRATTTRWKTRWYDSDTFDGSLIIWLRRCTEGWRLLRISMRGLVIPFDFNFQKDSIPTLYNQYAAKCNVFQDFQLTDEECTYIADGLLSINHDSFQKAYKPCENSISFILKSGFHKAEESIIPQKLLGELLRIRCLNEEDYWERRVNPDI